MTVTTVTGALGAVITGTDPRDVDFPFDQVKAALLEHEVVFFRGLNLTEQEHLDLGKRFGTLSIFPVARILGATGPTMTVIEDGPDSPNAADAWHTDVTWTPTPPAYALLHMELCPETGGDTLWCSATKAYDALSPQMQGFLCSLSAVHDNVGFIKSVRKKAGASADTIVEALQREYPPVEHPVIRTHPETGKRAIMYAERFIDHIVGLGDLESRAVIRFLGEHVKEAQFHVRWQWGAGDLAIWDERSTLHRAAADHWPQRRIVRRMEIDGDRPVFVA